MDLSKQEMDSSSEDSQLHIAESPMKNRRRKGKQEFKESMHKLDKTILETMAKCKNLTSETAKKMLCKLVKNDHVLALALLKAEEEEEQEIFSEDDESDRTITPKLTRLKAKQLNQQLPIPGSLLDQHEPDEDVVKLIQEELKSDDEEGDEEYQPEHDSDGDITNTTFSDIDSQPSTPGSALLYYEEIESPLKSGDFKVPKTPMTAEEQENIALRTRSKLCLQTTSIETIESTFIPPDIDYDLYSFNQNVDNEEEWEWMDFLNKYNLPLPGIDDEKDDDADPEYIAAESIPFDKEELRAGLVPKKELSDLISELFEDSSALLGEPAKAKSKNSESSHRSVKKQKHTPSKANKYSAPKISSKTYSVAELNTPPYNSEIDARNKNLETTPDQNSSSNQYYYSPSTPLQYSSPVMPSQSPNSTVISTPAALVSTSSNKTIQITPQSTTSILVMNQNQLEIRQLSDAGGNFNASGITSQGFYLNGVFTLPQYQSVVLQVPTIDLLKNGLSLDMPQSCELNAIDSNMTDDSKTQIKRDRKLSSFDYLNEETPQEKIIDETKGFSSNQLMIFEQQIRMHAQILAMNFLQSFAHPFWWNLADKNKANLIQLREINDSSHIENCLELCNSWENDLKENNEKNKKYIDFLHEEMELDQEAYAERKPFKGRFHNRFMERVLESKAIIYPSLLPHTSYRSIKFTKVDPPASELSLIALGYEHAFETLYKELNGLNPRKLRDPKIASIASTIIRQLGSFRSENAVIKMIDKYKSHARMNPIKYCFKHKRAPTVTHNLIDVSRAKAPIYLRRGLLPKIWENYKFSIERLQIHPFKDDGDEIQLINTIVHQQERNEPDENDISPSTSDYQEIITYTFENNKLVPLEEISKAREKSNEEYNLTSILKKVTNNTEKSPSKKKSVNFLLPIEVSPSERATSFKDRIIKTPAQKFRTIIENYFSSYSANLKTTNSFVQIVYNRFRSFDIYWTLVHAGSMLSKKNKIEGSNELSVKPKKQITSEEYSKRINRKLVDNRALIMQNSAKNDNLMEKDCSYACNFIERVKKTLLESGDESLYGEFMKMLTSFNADAESVPELYYKMETLLMPNYSDLLDLFLTFLLPEHAAEIGKFCEHFLQTRMTELIQHLNSYFHKQPSHMKKIYTCLNELSNDNDLSLEKLKNKILPLLKGNQILIEWFLGIFEAPSSHDEYETLHLKKQLNDSEICDYSYEEMQSQDLIESDSNTFSSCGVKFINGKIMYRCKTLLPAKISFLASDLTDDKMLSIKDMEEKTSFCVHEIRKHVQFSDKGSEEKPVKRKKLNKKYKVCDAQTLHAHAVRLNSIHAQGGEKINDALQILETNYSNVSSSHESPKKYFNKTAAKKSASSPKKALTKSPSSETSLSPSKVIQSPKRYDENDDEEQQAKRLKMDEDSSKEEDEPAWNRDEDKIILEAIKMGKGEMNENIDKLSLQLQRSRNGIVTRYNFLMNFLNNLSASV